MAVKQDIRNLSHEELARYLDSVGEKPYRAVQIFDWIYHKGVEGFDGMSNLSSPLREKLDKDFFMGLPALAGDLKSSDGTHKILFELPDSENIETVLIPTPRRSTVCVSTQAGCKFGCRFCASGIGGWKRNLDVSEIVSQIWYWKHVAEAGEVSHIVFMGIGEPLDNYENLIKAIRILNAKEAFNIGARRITVSTCGVIPKMKQLAQEGMQIELAVSLHGFDNQSRNVLMPVNKKYPFDELIEACRDYFKATKRQITFEYIMIKDTTCTEKAADALARVFKGMVCKMNLIPYNKVSEFDYETPGRGEIEVFRKSLKDRGIHATVRSPRGLDVSAACGQLRHSAGVSEK